MKVKKLYHTVLKDGGITVTPRLVRVKRQVGFFVSIKEAETILDLKEFTPDTLNQSIKNIHSSILRLKYHIGSREWFIGIWVDKANEKVYIDISVWIKNREQAVQKGIDEGQIAIWDIENGQEIYLK